MINSTPNFFYLHNLLDTAYPSVTLTSKQFKDFFTRIDENVCSMQDGKNKAVANSTGYKILQAVHISHSPYQYAPKSQKDFDTAAAKKLAEKYSADSIQQVIQDLSLSGHENKNYGKEIMQEFRAYGR